MNTTQHSEIPSELLPGLLGFTVLAGAITLPVGMCIHGDKQECDLREAELSYRMPTRMEYLKGETQKLAAQQELPAEWIVAARELTLQPVLNALVRAQHSLALMRNMLEYHIDLGLEEDFSINQVKVWGPERVWSAEIEGGPKYIEAARQAKAASLTALEHSLKELSTRTVSDGCDADSMAIAEAYRDLHVLHEHAKNGALSLDEQFRTVDKFGHKAVLGVSQPLFEAEAAVASAITQLRKGS